MRRPRVIVELASYIGILLRSGLRGDEGDAGLALLENVGDLEGQGPTPAVFLCLYRVEPERRVPSPWTIGEGGDASGSGIRLDLRRPPLWVGCRFLVAVRGRGAAEEAELISAAYRTLHDHSAISSEHLASIRDLAYADRYPVEILDEREAWREAGLSRPRLSVTFRVVVPIPSALADPLDRVLEREITIEEMP